MCFKLEQRDVIITSLCGGAKAREAAEMPQETEHLPQRRSELAQGLISMQLHVRACSAIMVLVSGLFAGGCGGSAYEAAFEESLEKYQLQTGFIDIADQRVTDLPKTDMTIRLPKIFLQKGSSGLDAQSPDPRNESQPLSRERV